MGEKKYRMIKGQWYRGMVNGISYELSPGSAVPDELVPYLKKNFPQWIEESGSSPIKSPEDRSIKSKDIKKK